MARRFLTSDAQLDVLVSLREVRQQLSRVHAYPHGWKWVVIALMSAVNGALVCNVNGTAQIGAYKGPVRKMILDAIEEGRRSGTPVYFDQRKMWLQGPDELIDLASSDKRHDSGAGPRLAITDKQAESFRHLKGFRDEMIHFKPTLFAWDVRDFPELAEDVLAIVGFARHDGHSLRHLSELDLNEFDCLFCEINDLLAELDARYQKIAADIY